MNEQQIIDRFEKNEADIMDLMLKVSENATNTTTLFKTMDEIKCSLQRIELAVYTKDDPFKKAVFDIGMWAIKVLVVGGALTLILAKVGSGV